MLATCTTHRGMSHWEVELMGLNKYSDKYLNFGFISYKYSSYLAHNRF